MLKTITSFVDSLGSLTYKGLWNAATNTPTLASGVGTTGDYYVVSVPGTTTLDGISSWAAGDWAIFNGSVWEKYNNPADTLGEVLANGNTTAGTDISVTTGDDITFADNSKAIFGAGDLQIYHDGNNSYIKDVGTGNLRIGADNLVLENSAATETFLYGLSGGSVYLSYANNAKLATTATGIDVTGTVTADGLTVDGLAAISSTTPEIRMFETDTTDLNTQLRSGVGKFEIKTLNDAVTLATKRFEIDHATGDISFYNDAAAQGLFWDSSASALGIGTTSPSSYFSPQLVVHSSTNLGGITIRSNATTDTNYLLFADGTSGNERYRGYVSYDHNSDTMKLATGASPAITIDSSQNLLVGKTAANSGTVGIEARSTGRLFATADGAYAAKFERLSSDGTLIQLTQDGASIGAIGTHLQDGQSNFFIGLDNASSDVGLGFGVQAGTGRAYFPCRADGSGVSDSISIGTSTYKYKDLYLSGGVYGGGAFSAGTTGDGSFFAEGAQHIFRKGSSGSYQEFGRFDLSGNLLVGTTVEASGTSAGMSVNNSGYINTSRDTTSFAGHHQFFNTNGLVGIISTTGSATTYATSSDQRLKDNIVDAPSASDDIDAIQVRSFDWKADGEHQKYGMVAQELLEVAPEAVSAPEDPEEMMGVDYSKLVPMMLKEIQSLRARVATLEGNPPQETTTTERVII